MKKALAVIGANFGDEGKGLMVDYLCATREVGIVVRHNGGAQAGHTVVTPTGERHIFRHFGSGTFLGIPTFLSQYFICNPIVALREVDELFASGVGAVELYAHPNCLVTTFADMIINQMREDALGDKRHGSVGVGFNETINRSSLDDLKITMSDLWNRRPLEDRLREICTKYAEYRTGRQIDDYEPMIVAYVRACERFANSVSPLGIHQCPSPLFEGAQGLLLDQDNREYFPHLTRSHTGIENVQKLCEQAGIEQIEPFYITRSYLTRHGAGPLPGEDPGMRYPDETNQPHAYQGMLRFAPINVKSLHMRVRLDAGKLWPWSKLVVTHVDQLGWEHPWTDFLVNGPTRNNVMAVGALEKANG